MGGSRLGLTSEPGTPVRATLRGVGARAGHGAQHGADARNDGESYRAWKVTRSTLYRPEALLGIAAAADLLACGARSDLTESAEGATTTVPTDGGTGTRTCPPECAIGHQCCLGGCSGPAVPMPSDCCTCLEGEVSSAYCGGLCRG